MWILHEIGYRWDIVQAMFYQYFGRNYPCGCGHTTKWKTILTIHDHQGVFGVPSKTPDYCPQCWARAAIKCAWCGRTILPGDAITLYMPKDKNFVIPEHAVVYTQKPRPQLVGCLGWDCAETGADRAGFWVMPGKVQRVMTPLEMVLANGGTDCVIVSDLADPREAIPIPDDPSNNE